MLSNQCGGNHDWKAQGNCVICGWREEVEMYPAKGQVTLKPYPIIQFQLWYPQWRTGRTESRAVL